MRLAAWLGDEGARSALEPDPGWTPFCGSHGELVTWAARLPGAGREGLERCAWVAAAAWLRLLAARREGPLEPRFREHLETTIPAALRALERRVVAPSDEAREAVRVVLREAWGLRHARDPRGLQAARLVERLGQLVVARAWSGPLEQEAVRVIIDADVPPHGVARGGWIKAGLGEGRVRETIRRAVAPWALDARRDAPLEVETDAR